MAQEIEKVKQEYEEKQRRKKEREKAKKKEKTDDKEKDKDSKKSEKEESQNAEKEKDDKVNSSEFMTGNSKNFDIDAEQIEAIKAKAESKPDDSPRVFALHKCVKSSSRTASSWLTDNAEIFIRCESIDSAVLNSRKEMSTA